MLSNKYTSESVSVTVSTKDRGFMKLDLDDMAQVPLFYNIYEWRDTPTIEALSTGSNTILDIGGNIGQMALLFAKFAKKVFTFEPIPETADRLQENINLNNLGERIVLSNVALTNFIGKISFGLPPAGNRGTGSTVITEQSKNRLIEVDAITLDEFIRSNKVTKIDLIKMDIEGAELFALQGMREMLTAPDKPIIILEMTIGMMRQAGYGSRELLDFLSSYGYDCYEFVSGGLKGPLTSVIPQSENYCFLTKYHQGLDKVKRILV